MNPFKIIFAILLILPLSVFAQKKNKKCNEGCAPKVTLYCVTNDSVQFLTHLNHNENRIKVVLEGGIENVKHTVFVTSKNAIIKKDSLNNDEYIVIPQKEICEIIVDVKTFEVYYSVRELNDGNKKVKEIIKEYPPKTYMVGYQHYEVK